MILGSVIVDACHIGFLSLAVKLMTVRPCLPGGRDSTLPPTVGSRDLLELTVRKPGKLAHLCIQ